MNVVYHSSDSFAVVTGVSITSLFENNKSADTINVWLIEHDITQENKNNLIKIANKYERKIYFIPMPDINSKWHLNLKMIKDEWLFDSYVRLFLDDILPVSVERVLYLDGDVLITDSLQELWHIDLQGKCAAAVTDSIGESYYEMFRLSKNARYCNSGVILMDLIRWRKQKIGDKVAEYVREHNGYVFFMEQTVFNAVLDSQIYILHPRYNVFSLMQCMSYDEHMYLRRPERFYAKKFIREAVEKPCLVHLTTCFFIINRAWIKNNNHPFKEIYLKYKEMTPWEKEPLSSDKRKSKKKIVDFFVLYLPRSFVIFVASFLYRYLRVWKIGSAMKKFQVY